MRRSTITAIATGIAAALSAAATADVIEYTDLSSGSQNAALALGGFDVTVTSHSGSFKSKTVGGFSAVGVSGGHVHGEIDGSESIQFVFDEQLTVSSISVAHLYTAGNYGDTWNETAMFSTDRGDFFLEATGAITASWSGSGVAYNDSPGMQGNGGVWTVSGSDVFGGPINWLKLKPGNAGSNASFGDYGFVGMTATAVPSPGAVALLALGSFVAIRRRRRPLRA